MKKAQNKKQNQSSVKNQKQTRTYSLKEEYGQEKATSTNNNHQRSRAGSAKNCSTRTRRTSDK